MAHHRVACRIIGITSFLILLAASVSIVLSVLSSTGRLGFPPDVRWVQYFTTYKRIMGIPIELGIAAVAMALFALRGSAWAVIASAILLAVGIGFVPVFRYNVVMWVIGLGGLGSLLAAVSRLPASLGGFLKELVRSLREFRRGSDAFSKTVIGALLVIVVALVVRQDILLNASEDAGHARLIEWYETARSRIVGQGKQLEPGQRITLELYTDYQCPSCRVRIPQFQAAAAAAGLRAEEVITKDYPLDATCNSSVPPGATTPHAAACAAAVAIRLVAREKPALKESLQSWLYSRQEALTPEAIRSWLEVEGLEESLNALYPTLLAEIRSDIEDATRAGVYSTPGIVLNGVNLPNLSGRGLEVLLRHVVTLQGSSR